MFKFNLLFLLKVYSQKTKKKSLIIHLFFAFYFVKLEALRVRHCLTAKLLTPLNPDFCGFPPTSQTASGPTHSFWSNWMRRMTTRMTARPAAVWWWVWSRRTADEWGRLAKTCTQWDLLSMRWGPSERGHRLFLGLVKGGVHLAQ